MISGSAANALRIKDQTFIRTNLSYVFQQSHKLDKVNSSDFELFSNNTSFWVILVQYNQIVATYNQLIIVIKAFKKVNYDVLY